MRQRPKSGTSARRAAARQTSYHHGPDYRAETQKMTILNAESLNPRRYLSNPAEDFGSVLPSLASLGSLHDSGQELIAIGETVKILNSVRGAQGIKGWNFGGLNGSTNIFIGRS